MEIHLLMAVEDYSWKVPEAASQVSHACTYVERAMKEVESELGHLEERVRSRETEIALAEEGYYEVY